MDSFCSLLWIVILLQFSSIFGSTVVNCSFTKYHGPFPMPDYSFCHFSQSSSENHIDWKLAGVKTSTSGRGPAFDHSGKGHYAYIDSSNEGADSYGRLTSPTFTKPASDSGGCVQFYYHMYGADIGTLNVSVYDNTQSGLVANWQKTGNQGDKWLRGDLNLNLPIGEEMNLTLTIEATVGGNKTEENKGDIIAVDDILVLTDGLCPTENSNISIKVTDEIDDPFWICDFEEKANPTCGLSLDKFNWATSTLSPNTGPKSGHNSDHFLHMPSAGLPQLATASVETPYLSAEYRCLTFYYHMYGYGMGKLSVYSQVNDIWQPLWSALGSHGNAWIKMNILLPQNSRKVRFKAIRGSTSDSDVALDDLQLSTKDCTTKRVTTSPTTAVTSVEEKTGVIISCDFEDDLCGWIAK